MHDLTVKGIDDGSHQIRGAVARLPRPGYSSSGTCRACAT